MRRLRVIHTLETLWTRIGLSAQIDPLVRLELDSIPDGTIISFSCQVECSEYVLELVKSDLKFTKVTTDLPSQPMIRIHCTSFQRLYELFCAKRMLSEIIATGDIRVQGPSPLVMSLIRLIQQSLPYTGGMKKARAIANDVSPPLEYQKRRIRYLFEKIRTRGVKT
jgi:hypothetical protein